MESGQRYTDSGQALELVSTQLEFGSDLTLVVNPDGTARVNGGIGGGVLSDLTDVTITTPAAGHYLRHNGTLWVNVLGVAAADVTSGTFGTGAFIFPSDPLTLGTGTGERRLIIDAGGGLATFVGRTSGTDTFEFAFDPNGAEPARTIWRVTNTNEFHVGPGGSVEMIIGGDPGTTELLRIGGTTISNASFTSFHTGVEGFIMEYDGSGDLLPFLGDSPRLVFRAKSDENPGAHTAEWFHYANVKTFPGVSELIWQSRIDLAGFTSHMRLLDDGSLRVAGEVHAGGFTTGSVICALGGTATILIDGADGSLTSSQVGLWEAGGAINMQARGSIGLLVDRDGGGGALSVSVAGTVLMQMLNSGALLFGSVDPTSGTMLRGQGADADTLFNFAGPATLDGLKLQVFSAETESVRAELKWAGGFGIRWESTSRTFFRSDGGTWAAAYGFDTDKNIAPVAGGHNFFSFSKAPTGANLIYDPTAGSGPMTWFRMGYTLNQTGSNTSDVTAFRIACTETAVTGTHRFIDFRISGTSRFEVFPDGKLRITDGTDMCELDSGNVVAGWAGLWFDLTPTVTNYALLGDGGTNTLLNAETGGQIDFRIGNSVQAFMTASLFQFNDEILVNGGIDSSGDYTMQRANINFINFTASLVEVENSIELSLGDGAADTDLGLDVQRKPITTKAFTNNVVGGLSPNDVVFINSSGQWQIATAALAAILTLKIPFIGIVIDTAAQSAVTNVCIGGNYFQSNLLYGAANRGKPVYMSTTSGKPTLTAPTAAGEIVFKIGNVAGTNDILIQPMYLGLL